MLPPVTNTVLPSGLTATETAPSVLLPEAVVPLQPQPGTGGGGVADGGAVRARGGPGAFSGGKHLGLPSRCGYQRVRPPRERTKRYFAINPSASAGC